MTPIIPNYQEINKHCFVDGFTPYTASVQDVSFLSAPLKFGQSFSLLGLASNDALLEKGVIDPTSTIDRGYVVAGLCLSIENAKGQTIHVLEKVSTQDHIHHPSMADIVAFRLYDELFVNLSSLGGSSMARIHARFFGAIHLGLLTGTVWSAVSSPTLVTSEGRALKVTAAGFVLNANYAK